MNDKRSQLNVINDIMNDKKGHNTVNDSLLHKPDGLLSKYSRNVNTGNAGIKLQYNKTVMLINVLYILVQTKYFPQIGTQFIFTSIYIECYMYLSEALQYEREH